MEPAGLSSLAAWESFYVIVGSSAAALTGLQFVVIALAAEAHALRGPEVGAFGTPTIVHFCGVLAVSAILSAPFPLASYLTLLVSAALLDENPAGWLFLIAASTLFLLFIGIHNAWDAVTYIASQGARSGTARRNPGAPDS